MKAVSGEPGDQRRMPALVLVALVVGGGVYGLLGMVLSSLAQEDPANAQFVAASTNDPPGTETPDPGYDKAVADCTAVLVSDDLVEVVLSNAYPGYECTIGATIANSGDTAGTIDLVEITADPGLMLEEVSDLSGTALSPDEQVQGAFRVLVEQSSSQSSVLTFTVEVTASEVAITADQETAVAGAVQTPVALPATGGEQGPDGNGRTLPLALLAAAAFGLAGAGGAALAHHRRHGG